MCDIVDSLAGRSDCQKKKLKKIKKFQKRACIFFGHAL